MRLHVSQAYLALLETGRRQVTAGLGTRMAKLYGLGAMVLPLTADHIDGWTPSSVAQGVASLGYPGFRQLATAPMNNPAVVLLAALASSDLEVRVIEALPWLALEYSNLNWDWVVREAKIRDLQNRLGFVVTLARQTAEKRGMSIATERLREVEHVLDRARLVREDTLCQESLTSAERRWLRRERPAEALRWNLLTDMDARALHYAA